MNPIVGHSKLSLSTIIQRYMVGSRAGPIVNGFARMKNAAAFAKSWKADAQRTSKYGSHIAKLTLAAQSLITAEAPDSLPVITPSLQLLEKLAAVNADVATAKLRISNDIRDLAERFRVIDRVMEHRKSARRALESATAKLSEYEDEVAIESKRKDYNLKRAEGQLAKLRAAKKEALIRARDLTVLLIEERRKFSRFVFRRTQQAYVRLGTTLTRDSSLELAILIKTIEALQKARSGEVLEILEIEVPPIVPLSLADDDDQNDQFEVAAVLIDDAEPRPPPAPAPAPAKLGPLLDSAVFDEIVLPAAAKPAEEPPKTPQGREDVAEGQRKKKKLFDVEEIEAHLPKRAVAEDVRAGGDVPADGAKPFFDVELPPELPPEDDAAKSKVPVKKTARKGRGKRALAAPSPFDEI
jgi:hypothetical protein